MRATYTMAVMFLATVAIIGCTATPATQVNSAAPPVSGSANSWDGTYRGSVQITGLGSGVKQQWCETDPQIIFQVTHNAFSYAMPHPNAPNNPTPVYSATIASDGSFRSSLSSGTMTGRVTGTHIAGKIDGSVCVYSFALDRT